MATDGPAPRMMRGSVALLVSESSPTSEPPTALSEVLTGLGAGPAAVSSTVAIFLAPLVGRPRGGPLGRPDVSYVQVPTAEEHYQQCDRCMWRIIKQQHVHVCQCG
jgi:hypothetical protein